MAARHGTRRRYTEGCRCDECRGAQRLYQRFGFKAVGVRKGYYADTGEDALIMWANEVDQPEYAALLDRLERAVPGTTVRERPKSR